MALHRAGPAIIASAATVVARHAVPAVRRDQLDQGPRPGRRDRHRRRSGRDAHAAAGAAGHVGRWIFWPARPRVGTAEPTATGVWARVGARIARRPRTTWVVTAAVLAIMALGIIQLERDRPDQQGVVPRQPGLGRRRGGARRALRRPAAGSPVVVISNADQADEVRTAFAGSAGIDPDTVTPPVVKGGTALHAGHADRSTGQPGGLRHRRPGPRPRARGARRRRQGRRRRRRSTSTCNGRRSTTAT